MICSLVIIFFSRTVSFRRFVICVACFLEEVTAMLEEKSEDCWELTLGVSIMEEDGFQPLSSVSSKSLSEILAIGESMPILWQHSSSATQLGGLSIISVT